MGERTKICRAWATQRTVRIETAPGVVWEMPNPTPEGKTYHPDSVLSAVRAVGAVDLERWRRVEDE